MKGILAGLKDFLGRLRLLPSFDEDTVFLLALAVVITLVIDGEARAFGEVVMANSSKVTLIALLGIGFAFYTAFFALFKNEIQKFYMLWFAVAANFISAVAVINLINESGASPLYYIAPALNILIAAVMTLFWYADVLDTSTIPHKSSSYTNIFYGALVIVAITALSAYVLDWSWPVAISLSVAYASLFNRSFARYLPRVFKARDERMEKIDTLTNKLVEHLRASLNDGGSTLAALGSSQDVRDVRVNDDDDIDTKLNDEARTLLATEPLVATGAVGFYTYKRFWFTPERSKTAIIVDVYEQGPGKGYRFSQMLEADDEDTLNRFKGLMYLGRINNIQ